MGLIGSQGILPLGRFLEAVRGVTGPERYWLVPTLSWINSSDGFLHFLCGTGILFSLAAILGILRTPSLCLLWLIYLSLVVSGQDFMEFQWDNLLLEAGFLAILLSLSPAALWLLGWLLFRLMFSSGFVKLASGDATWRNLTALNFHYETQPLPTWIGWYAHQLPEWMQKFSVSTMFVVEIFVPFLIFGPRRLRLFACAALISLQVLIAATGNYCFFNLLAVALCLLLIDDACWPQRLLPKSQTDEGGWRKWVIVPFAGIILTVSSMLMTHLLGVRLPWPLPMAVLYQVVSPLRSVNGYGLFAVMTTKRTEIVLEGSRDGVEWKPYEFKWKPGDPKRRPGFVAPHQPRLDWQMWFAALGTARQNPWFLHVMERLLEGSPEVVALLEKNPFPKEPPRYLRAASYDYHFTDLAERRSQGTWWRREREGLYLPTVSLRQEGSPEGFNPVGRKVDTSMSNQNQDT